ncbi:hypothetical protein XH97_21940 [Bradyrhizobium sp. CCBAU 53380]|nr:hypothetical protein [Bradyrhizobium sp. CCBAU 53380]
MPSAHIPAPVPDGWRALTFEAERGRCRRRVVPRLLLLTEIPALQLAQRADAVAATAPCPRLVTIAKRPLWRAGCADIYDKSEFL